MKKPTLFLLLILNTIGIFSQIKFEQASLKELQLKAKKENKLIFVDCYTSWCGPCKWMDKNIYTNDSVAQYFNATFINTKFDMEVGEGINIAKQYTVAVFPSFLFLDGDGNLIHRSAGAWYASLFIPIAKDALIPEKQFSTLVKKYESGNRNAEFIKTYLDALAGVRLDTKTPFDNYFKTQKEEDYIKQENWNLIYNHLNDEDSKEFKYLLKNTALFNKKYSADSVKSKIFMVYTNTATEAISSKLDSDKKYFDLKEKIKKSGYDRSSELLISTDMFYYYHKSDFINYAKAAVVYIDTYNNNNINELNKVAYEFYQVVKDKNMLIKAEAWAKKAVELDPTNFGIIDTYACVLFVNNKKEEALKTERHALKLLDESPTKYDPSIRAEFEENIKKWSK